MSLIHKEEDVNACRCHYCVLQKSDESITIVNRRVTSNLFNFISRLIWVYANYMPHTYNTYMHAGV